VAYVHFQSEQLRYTRWDGVGWGRMDGSAGYDVVDSDVAYTSVAKNFLVHR
jgi:hypothetical protein